MDPQSLYTKGTPGTPVAWRPRAWRMMTLLLVLTCIVAPLGAALAQDIDIGEDTEGFIEFGGPDGDVATGLAQPMMAPVSLAAPMLASVQAAPSGDLPSYDEEALAEFDVQKVLESDRHLAIDIGPRLTGTPQEQEAAEYFGAKLASYGYEVSYQHWNTRNDGTNRTQNVAAVTSPNADLQGGPDQTLGGPNWQMSASASAKFTGDEGAVEGEVIYAGPGQSDSDFPADTAGKIVMMDYASNSSARNASVENAVSHGAIAVILARLGGNSSPPSFSLATPQPDMPVVGGGTAHGDWIRQLIADGLAAGNPLRLRIATYSYTNEGTNVIGVRHAVNDPEGTSAPIIMVGGHIDSVLGAPGGHDNGTGPSTAVEAGRVLAEYALDKEIRIVGYGGEEIGMYGSRAYVASLTPEEIARFVGAWDMDMEGTPYPPAGFFALTPDGESNSVVQSAHDSAARFGFMGMQNCKLGQSDHQSFFDAGIPASLFIWLDYHMPAPPATCVSINRGSYTTEPQYHRPTDTMSNVSPERLEISLKVVGGAAFHSALNAVTLSAVQAGVPIADAMVEADCGDGWRYLGETDGSGEAQAAIPHATCDFKASSGFGFVMLDDVAISGDTSLTLAAPIVVPNPVLLHGSASLVDETSDIDWASCGLLDTISVGEKTALCTAADGDGDLTTASIQYNVAYAFSGFSRPVDNPPALNIANAGRVVPLVWQLTDAYGVPVTSDVDVMVTAQTFACATGETLDNPQEYAPGQSGLQNLGDGNWQFNWQTPPAYARSCKTLELNLGEGAGLEHLALFNFTR